ncbi:MAG: hypothetical protein A2Y58_03810 [Chloroflexi bacterium RBG_13_51_52]|nr:MAG: hypothetical protein A2Y58_03810 [Chloroflexi bacterium RBG_13_51_52]
MANEAKKPRKLFSRAEKPEEAEIQPVVTASRWGGWREWVNIILLFVVLEIAVLSIEQAHWITPQPSLSLVLFLSVLIVYAFVRIRIFGVIKHVLALVIGLGVVLWQTMALLTPPETVSRFSHLLDIFRSWWQGSETLLPGDEKIIFVVFITFLTWVIGYLSTWFVLRRNNSWVAVSLGSLVILFNVGNLPDTYYIYFFLYFFAAALLVAVTRMTGQSSKAWRIANYSGRSLLYLGVSLLCITALAASISWITPQARATGLQDLIATRLPWQRDVLGSKFNILNAIPSKQALSTASTLKDLTFGESWNQGNDIKYVVASERPSYWRVNAYDTYTAQGWTNSPTSKNFLEADITWVDNEGLTSREVMKYAVATEINTDVLFTSGGFISADIPVHVNTGAAGDIEAVTALRILSPGERYTITAYVFSPTEDDLSGAGENYPDSIKAAYLQLPPDFSNDIKLLSEDITREFETPYEKVTAIIDYLAQFPYKLEIEAPPEGTDSVAHFLFTRKNGFCLHYASATVVMLRSIGIPSRLVVGYLPGEPGKIPGQYILRDKYYHAWPQVYFPGYGWIDIEATPGSPESYVSIDTPFVSSTTIEESPEWDAWLGAPPPQIQNITNIGIGLLPGSETSEAELSFGAKLGRTLLFVFSGALAIVLLIGLIFVIRSFSYRWLWRVDRQKLAYDTYTNMCKLAAMVGLAPNPQQTPLEFTAELAVALPQEVEALDYITRAYLINRFGGRRGRLIITEEAEILKARHMVYHTLLQRLGLTRRFFGKR